MAATIMGDYGSLPTPSLDRQESSEEEEEVVVKSKPILSGATLLDEEEGEPASLEEHIEHPPPPANGRPVMTTAPEQRRERLMLELAETQSRGDATSQSQLIWGGGESNGEFGLSGKFRVQGRRCTLRLEDDTLQWTWQGKGGSTNMETLSLADIFAVVISNSKGRPDPQGSQFVIHALKSRPGSCGDLLEIMCQPMDPHPAATSQTWAEYLSQQIQNFGHRPRRVYVIINPTSGNGSGLATWSKVEPLFQLAHVHTEIFVTQRRFHAREVIQGLVSDQYDGIIVVGGDGIFNEVLNGLMLQTQQSAGVDLRRSRFIPVQPNIRIGIIPAGFSNSVAWSVLGTRNPKEAAAQVLLGCSSPIDVCSLFNTGQLLLFSAGALCYGLQAEVAMLSNDFVWLGQRRVDVAQLRAVLTKRDFETEIMYIPIEDSDTVSTSKDKCYSRCPKCSDFNGVVESPCVINEKGASVMATYSNVDRLDQQEWKKITGSFSTVIACPLTCRSHQAPGGMSPWAHQANGCVDLILVEQCTKIKLVKWFLKQRKTTQLALPYVQIHRVKEFKFREILTPPPRAEEEVNLVSDEREDDDEATNRSAGGAMANRLSRQQSRDVHPTSHWNVDGDDLNRVDIDVRVHRHLLQMFARGVEPLVSHDLDEMSRNESLGSSHEILGRSVQQLIPS